MSYSISDMKPFDNNALIQCKFTMQITLLTIKHSFDILSHIVIITMKPGYKDRSKETRKVVCKGRWSSCTSYFNIGY